jgi:hypothetical protein
MSVAQVSEERAPPWVTRPAGIFLSFASEGGGGEEAATSASTFSTSLVLRSAFDEGRSGRFGSCCSPRPGRFSSGRQLYIYLPVVSGVNSFVVIDLQSHRAFLLTTLRYIGT